jgi:hypothetical protein
MVSVVGCSAGVSVRGSDYKIAGVDATPRKVVMIVIGVRAHLSFREVDRTSRREALTVAVGFSPRERFPPM